MFFMLNAANHEICPANQSQITNNINVFLARHSFDEISLLINMKIQIILAFSYLLLVAEMS